jgi:ribonuclease P protein component
VLSAPHRLRSSADFGVAVRRGRRAGTSRVVVHAAGSGAVDVPARVGFVVGKSVGPAVVRNRTKRRLRALMRPLVRDLLPGAVVVVRANPAAAAAPGPALERDLRSALVRAGTAAGVLAAGS